MKPEAAMIPRYSRPEMTAIWDPQTRFRIWFEIEAHAADAMAELGIIPKEARERSGTRRKTPTSTSRASTRSSARPSTTSSRS
jgi:adenylosuccinate lyase